MEGASVSSNVDPKSKPTLVSARRTIPTSSYDLLEGTFQTATKARNVGIALVASGFLLFGFVGTNGFISGSSINSINAQAEAAKLGQMKVSNDLGKIDGYPKLSALALLKKDNQTKKRSLFNWGRPEFNLPNIRYAPEYFSTWSLITDCKVLLNRS